MYILWLLHILRLLLLFFKGRRVELCKGLAIAMLFTSKLVRARTALVPGLAAATRVALGARRRTVLARRARALRTARTTTKLFVGIAFLA